jgi:hypothetical protein
VRPAARYAEPDFSKTIAAAAAAEEPGGFL